MTDDDDDDDGGGGDGGGGGGFCRKWTFVLVCLCLSLRQKLLANYERCRQLRDDYETAGEVINNWLISARRTFDTAEQLKLSHEDLLRKQQLIKVDDVF